MTFACGIEEEECIIQSILTSDLRRPFQPNDVSRLKMILYIICSAS
jgi:hypothetical protein